MAKKPISSILLWISWFLVSVLGFTLGRAIVISLMPDLDHKSIFPLVTFPISGLLIGLGQWTILRTRMRQTWMWIPATSLGLLLGTFIGGWVCIPIADFASSRTSGFLQTFFANVSNFPLIMLILAGMFAGAFQWFALYRKLKGSFGWILVSTISWSIAPVGIGAISGAFVESTLVNPRHETT